MLSDVLSFYRFAYEIEVYLNYTPLKNEMLLEKMNQFWGLISSENYNNIVMILSCFYGEDNKKGMCYVNEKNSTNTSLIYYSDEKIIFNTKIKNKKNKNIVFLPYYLYENNNITDLNNKYKNGELSLYEFYKIYKTNDYEFIWNKPFIIENGEDIQNKINTEKEAFKKKHTISEIYQQMFCLLIFNSPKMLEDEKLSSLAGSFGLVISEWGRDILKQNIVKYSSKAAMTAIMSRNMSHNIGSHAVSLWNMQLNEQLKGKSDADQGNEPLKSVKDSKDLFQYLQHRMDFIAEVSTSIPSSEMTMNFKNDIMQPFIDQEVLLKNIAASEGIEVNIDNKKDVVVPKDCERVSIPNGIIGTHAIYSIFENFIRNAAKHYKGTEANFKIKVELKIPSSVKLNDKTVKKNNGKYEIINGILRVKNNGDNTTHILTKQEQEEIKFKFNKNEDKKILDRFFFIHERYIEMHIWDMRCNSCDKVSVDDKTTTVVEKLREYLDTEKSGKFIDEEGRLQAGGWGFKEMITSANFLRKNPTDKIIEQMDEKEPPLMQIICGDGDNESACKENECHRSDTHKNKLGVLFYLRKPKDMLVFGKGLADIITKDKFEIEAADPASWPQKDGKLTKDIPHRLLLVPDDDSKKKYIVDPKAPMRIMKCNNGEIKSINDNLYLSKYKEFIKDKKNKLLSNGEFPKLCYGGGGKEFDNVLLSNNTYLKWVKKENGNNNQASPTDCLFDNKAILFYRHAEESKNKETVKSLLKDNLYFQPVHGNYSSANRLDILPTDELIQEHFFLELIESALISILIIDERVSDLADKAAFHEIKNSEIFKNMRIHVLDIDKKNVTKKAIKEEYESINGNYIHFLVIHQGILDKLEKNEKDSSISMIKDIKHRWLVIDSGRGVPTEIEHFKQARFVETSALLKMLETYDKHALVQTLFALRRPDVD